MEITETQKRKIDLFIENMSNRQIQYFKEFTKEERYYILDKIRYGHSHNFILESNGTDADIKTITKFRKLTF